MCDTEDAFVTAAAEIAAQLTDEGCTTFTNALYNKHWTLAPGAQLTDLGVANDAIRATGSALPIVAQTSRRVRLPMLTPR